MFWQVVEFVELLGDVGLRDEFETRDGKRRQLLNSETTKTIAASALCAVRKLFDGFDDVTETSSIVVVRTRMMKHPELALIDDNAPDRAVPKRLAVTDQQRDAGAGEGTRTHILVHRSDVTRIATFKDVEQQFEPGAVDENFELSINHLSTICRAIQDVALPKRIRNAIVAWQERLLTIRDEVHGTTAAIAMRECHARRNGPLRVRERTAKEQITGDSWKLIRLLVSEFNSNRLMEKESQPAGDAQTSGCNAAAPSSEQRAVNVLRFITENSGTKYTQQEIADAIGVKQHQVCRAMPFVFPGREEGAWTYYLSMFDNTDSGAVVRPDER
jgi:hypothetical protein